MDEFDTRKSFGNYVDVSDSVMVFIPKHYVKLSHDTAAPYSGLRVDVSSGLKRDTACLDVLSITA